MRKNKIKRTYLTYRFNNDVLTLAFRSEYELNKHIKKQNILEKDIKSITDKMPINPHLTDTQLVRMLELVGCKTIYPIIPKKMLS